MQLKTIFLLSFLLCYSYFFSQEINFKHDIKYAFVENKGQWDSAVLFKSKFDGGNLWIQNKKFVFHFQDFSKLHATHGNTDLSKQKLENLKNRQTVVHLNFKNANNFRVTEKLNPSSNYYNYFIGNDPTKWTSEVRGYNEALIKNIYKGVDLKLIEDNSKLKYEFHVSPNTATDVIQLEFVGQEKVFVDKNGDLHIQTEIGEVIEEKPFTYQIINGKIKEVECAFKVQKNIVSFKLGEYDSSKKLIIDPTLVFATYSGSVTDNFGMTATYAHNGEAYSGGTIFGNQYPTPDNNAYNINSNFTVNQGADGITDVFISKYSSDGTQMLWTNFIGGGNNNQGTETVHSLIADKEDNLYLYGATSSTDFPIVNGYQANHAGGIPGLNFNSAGVRHLNQGTDIYVSKISANGQQLMGSTYFGGASNDGVNYNSSLTDDSLMTNYGDNSRGEIMLDSVGNCIIASCTRSSNFPLLNAFQQNISGQQDGVLFMLNKDLSSLVWSSYFGGTNNDMINSVKIDSTFNIVFAGGTSSNDLPQTTGTWQPSYNGGNTDGFVGRLSPDGLTLKKVSYIGTANYDNVFFTEVDRDGYVYLFGQSFGGNFPVVNAGFVNPNSNQFICKLDSSLSNVINSTTFGNGDPSELNLSPSAFLVDRCGSIYVSGWGASLFSSTPLNNMPISNDAIQTNSPNGYDFYLMVINNSFNNLIYGSYIGGNQSKEHVDGGTSRFDVNGIMYQSVCGGCGGFSDFQTTPNAWSDSNLTINRCNNILFKFDFNLIPNSEFNVSETSGCTNEVFQFENNSTSYDGYLWDFGNGDTTSIILNPSKTFDTAGVYTVKLYVTEDVCHLTDSTIITINISDTITNTTTPDIFQCLPSPQLLVANSNGTADTFIWSSSDQFNDTLNTSTSDSTLSVNLTPGYYKFFVKYDNPGGCFETDSVSVYFPENDYSINGKTSICTDEEPTFTLVNNSTSVNYTYVWSNDSIITTNPTLSTIDINPKTPQYLYIELTSDSGCVILDSVYINVYDTIFKSPTSDIFECENFPQLLIANSNGSAETFIWSSTSQFNDTLNTFTNDSTLSVDLNPGSYKFYIKYDNPGGCFKTDSIKLDFPDNQYSIEGKKNLCATEEPTFTLVNNNPLINYTYSWSSDSIIKTDPNLSSIDINPKIPQYLFVELTSDSGCLILDSVFINIGTLDANLVNAFTSDTLVPVGQTITLNALPDNEQYSWEPSAQVNTPESQETKAVVNKSSYFKVTVSDGVCSASDSVFVKTFQYLCDDPSIFVPNAFSPNGDGNNDVLYVNGNMIDKMIFRVYDRWGTLIFESKNRLEGWDGTYNGKKLDPDVYDYYLQATCIDNVESIVKGNITLLK